LKALQDIIVPSAESIGVFNTGFNTVNLHHPTLVVGVMMFFGSFWFFTML
jgi:hypothetical protein